jgi:hypothetical protein
MRLSCPEALKHLRQPVVKARFTAEMAWNSMTSPFSEQDKVPFSAFEFLTGAEHYYEDPR